MRVAIYVRVSTDKQDTDMQENALRERVLADKHEVGLVYRDVYSGRCNTREAMNRMFDDAAKKRFDMVYVWKLDRFGRSTRDLLNNINALEKCGIAFVSHTDKLDLSTPVGRLMLHVLAAMAEFEADLIRERVRAGIAEKRAQGAKWGRQPGKGIKKYGSKVYDTDKMEEMLIAGHSLQQIANACGCSKSFAQVVRRRYLKRLLSAATHELQSSEPSPQ